MLISVIVPVYNEAARIEQVITRLEALNDPVDTYELVIVDDGSTDGTKEILYRHESKHQIVYHDSNRGKGAALRTGFTHARGEIVVLHDADLEYDPADIAGVVEPIINTGAPVVYGSRMIGKNPIGYHAYYWGNRLIASAANILYGSSLTDVETGAKAFHRDVLLSLSLARNDFGFEAEVTAALLKKRIQIVERPISYQPRSFAEGKKISWRDGITALWILVSMRFS